MRTLSKPLSFAGNAGAEDHTHTGSDITLVHIVEDGLERGLNEPYYFEVSLECGFLTGTSPPDFLTEKVNGLKVADTVSLYDALATMIPKEETPIPTNDFEYKRNLISQLFFHRQEIPEMDKQDRYIYRH